ncbi:mannose-6-phosphate isomerase [Pelomonas saccharophila]|uniref:Mannose-6-phosphate isomerase n=1 Tax=Roseateles saccharophilus TaxID=304 RepID=A0ABU1YPQ7_ROSSA|nr:AGE family epimerase/isomerase [Roseateles saccharophilus]MDR7270718.1 mannose-6-phosphate isomerase [Roseateles saccharophilus]
MVAEFKLHRRAVLALLAAVAACSDPDARIRNRIDTGWHRDDLEALLLHWHGHALRPDGSFQLAFDRAWKPQPQPELELTGQARLVYAFAAGHEYIPDAGYLKVARRGADYLLQRFRDPVHGGFFYSVTPEGAPKGTAKRAYGHAFALLALAEVYRIGGDVRYRDAALQAWREIELNFFDPAGGLFNECERDFKPVAGSRTQNPLMHMFEALLALREATGDKIAENGARRLGDFVVNQLMQGQAEGSAHIPEWYDEAWKPLPTQAAGGYIDLGHQFEWSHLLTTGAVVSPIYAQVAERVLSYALASGYDDIEGGCGLKAFPDGGKTDTRKGWWQQAECLHGLLVGAKETARNDLWRRYEQTQELIKKQLIDAEYGGWRAADVLPCKSGGCKDVQPDPYHMVRLHQAALKLASG